MNFPPSDLIITILVAGLSTLTVTELTAKSAIAQPFRGWVAKRYGIAHARNQRIRQILDRLSYAVGCPFCTSFWHAAWLVPVLCHDLGLSSGAWPIVYLPTIAIAKLLNDLSQRHQQPPVDL